MALYTDVTVGSIAELDTAVSTFLTANGWTLGTASTSSGVKSCTATKNGHVHNVAIADNGRFTKGCWNGDGGVPGGNARIIYVGAVGLAGGGYTEGAYLIACQFTYPMRCLFFELANNSLMFSFEIGANKWRHVLSANLAGNPNGIESFMSASYAPAACYAQGDGLQNSTDLMMTTSMSSYNTYLGCQFLAAATQYGVYNNKGYYPRGGGSSLCLFKVNGVWLNYSSSYEAGVLTKVNASIAAPVGNPDSGTSHSAANIPGVYRTGRNSLTGSPVLFPMFYANTTTRKILLQVPDIYSCAASVCVPGQKISMGTQDYFTLPFGNHADDNACMAVRCN